MDFKRRCVRRSLIKPTFSGLNEFYPHFMQFYKSVPNYEVSFKEFEECTAERLCVLQIIDEVNGRGLKGEAWRLGIKEELRKQPELRLFTKLITGTSCGSEEDDFKVRRRDHISHYVLRLAYCDSEDKRRWFTSREVDLFKLRWMFLEAEQTSEFLALNNINFDQVPEMEKIGLASESGGMIQTEKHYYKISFVLVSDLVRGRKVFLKKGLAHISSADIISVLLTSYRAQLSHSLAYASRRIHLLDEDERIFGILKGAGKNVREVSYVIKDKETINIANLDALSETSYPLCMQHLHQTLRKEHHLKHFSRLQYGLFLKGIGVTLEDSLQFWRKEFTKKMDVEKFEKSYTYSIRHNYGKEGKMANYSPHSCMKIITQSVNPGEHHGCPFRHKDSSLVKKMLLDNGLSTIGAQEVLEYVRNGHYQLACGKYFQIRHGVDAVISHPNSYFDESQKFLTGRAIKKESYSGTPSSSEPSAKAKVSDDVWGNDASFDFSSVNLD